MNKAVHLSLSQTFASLLCTDYSFASSLCPPPTLSYTVRAGGVTNVGSVVRLVVTVIYHTDITAYTPLSQLQGKQCHKDTVVRSRAISFPRTPVNVVCGVSLSVFHISTGDVPAYAWMSTSNLLKDSPQVEYRLVAVLNHNVRYNVVKFDHEPTEAVLCRTYVLHVLWKHVPVDPFLIRRWDHIPSRVCLHTLLGWRLAFDCQEG